MKSIFIVFFFIAGIIISITSCEYDHPQPFPENVDTVSFALDLVPYFDQSCNMAGCHNTGGINPDLSEANGYQSIINTGMLDLNNPENSKLYKKLLSGQSMEQYSTPSETAMILAWIKQGALDN